ARLLEQTQEIAENRLSPKIGEHLIPLLAQVLQARTESCRRDESLHRIPLLTRPSVAPVDVSVHRRANLTPAGRTEERAIAAEFSLRELAWTSSRNPEYD